MITTRTNGNGVFMGMFTEMEKESFQEGCLQETLETVSKGLADRKNISGVLEGSGWKAFMESRSPGELTDCINRVSQGAYDTTFESTSNKENLE